MKLARYGRAGKEKPALVDREGKLRDLSEVVADIDADVLSPRALARLAKLKPESLPAVRGTPRIGPCLAQVGNFVAVGLNYADHAAESGMPVPKEPILFNKAPSCLSGPNDDVMIPKGSTKTDWEVELAIVIGTRANYVSESEALRYVSGFCLCNDVSEREFQLERSGQWMKGKGSPTFGPLGPWLVTLDEIKDVQALDMWLDVNGQRMQTGSTKTMIFGVKTLISYISQFMLLEPGDVITTGTPPGVGSGMKPPRFLKAGDTITLGIDGLGQQTQNVVAWKAATVVVDGGGFRLRPRAGLHCALCRLRQALRDLVR
jgi:2-keto-4-pentenoate hydratase/2-oxohepta-3-ene-1,7-dioic acid hydratase in catechol pathway